MNIIYGDITKANVDVIVNAANGIGFMGGIVGRFIKLPGVAESIHYATKGDVEKEAKEKSRKHKWIPSFLYGHCSGECYVTNAESLSCKWIIHAVTMPYPGMRTTIRKVRLLIPEIIKTAQLLKARSIAIPLLGTGTGGLNEEEVLALFKEEFSHVQGIDIIIFRKV
ncbi:O-acetyl-ADP-ribose deacetylase (regulator of RNase III) [Paenibacillus sp. 1182]|uniref:macro domain-containing protein n=1 Tax=Paenibacillus sp. 1182 TaxID=2806565 RepID=UPI001AE63CBF|nr:macro domain-containing protein [Paenibacillus sp. 1182]MBP1308980.1 O-acetyl-ADP-ribose deacetylase (regulator of RNase III) [Paenibacillus sp. 1182]